MFVCYSLDLSEPQPYKIQLGILKNLILGDGESPHEEKVIQKLGTSVAALYSVPTAIFCFLRAQKPITGIQTENPFRRAIQYAVNRLHITYCNKNKIDIKLYSFIFRLV